MPNLGSFGTPKAAVPDEGDTFDWFGSTVRVRPDFGELDLADFFEIAARIDDTDTASSLSALKGIFREAIHVEDFDVFWSTAKAQRQGIADLMQVLVAIVEAVADRPTGRPADSSVGPSQTNGTSAGGSSSRAIARLEGQGRPDLALLVHQAEDSRVSA